MFIRSIFLFLLSTFWILSPAASSPLSPGKVDPVGNIRFGQKSFLTDSLRKYYLLDSLSAAPFFFNNNIVRTGRRVQSIAMLTAQGRPVMMHYFQGKTDKKALVIGGMHGTELSSIALAEVLINFLSDAIETPEFSVLIIPELFPDNAALARVDPLTIGSIHNIGRYSSPVSADPNRQMPGLGRRFDQSNPVDALGRVIENENRVLLSLIRDYAPGRIINLHAIRDIRRAGIFADPRTDANQFALGYAEDSILAIDMAKYIYARGGRVAGNRLENKPTALYYHDPAIAEAGCFQKRNFSGSCLTSGRGNGVSLGSWAATAIDDSSKELSRAAMTMLTLEFPGCKRPEDYTDPAQQEFVTRQLKVYAEAIQKLFL